MATERISLEFTADNKAHDDINKIEKQLKDIERIQKRIGESGVKSAKEVGDKTRLITRKMRDDWDQLLKTQIAMGKAGENVPDSLKRKYRTLFLRLQSGYDQIRNLNKRITREELADIKAIEDAREKAHKDRMSRNKKAETESKRRWREEQRLYEFNYKRQISLEKQLESQQERRLNKLQGLLLSGMFGGMGLRQAGLSGLRFTGDLIEASKMFEQLRERLTNIEGSAAAAEAQLNRFKEAVKLPGVTFDVLSQFSVQLGRVGVTGKSVVDFVTNFANAASLFGMEAGATTRVLRQMVDTIDKAKIEQDDLNSILESGGFIADHIKSQLNGMAVRAANLNSIVGNTTEAWLEFWDSGVGGSLADETRARTDTITVAQENLQNALQMTAAALGDELVPAYKLATSAAEGFLETIENLPKPLRAAIAGTIGLGSIAATVVGTIVEFGSQVGLLIISAKQLGIGFAAVKTATVAVGSALSALAAPVFLVTAGITTLTLGIIGILRNMGLFKEKIEEVEISAGDFTKKMGEMFKEAKEGAKAFDTINHKGRTMINLISTAPRKIGDMGDAIENLSLKLVEADDKLARTRIVFGDAKTPAAIDAAATRLKNLLSVIERAELAQVDVELMPLMRKVGKGEDLSEDEQADLQELQARRKEIQLRAERERAAVDADSKKRRDKIKKDESDEDERRRELQRSSQKKQAQFTENLAKSLSNFIIAEYKREFDAWKGLEEGKFKVREEISQKILDNALKSNKDINQAQEQLSLLYIQRSKEEIALIEKSDMTKTEKELAIFRVQSKLRDQLMDLTDKVHKHNEDIQKRELESAQNLAEARRSEAEITAQRELDLAVSSNDGIIEALENAKQVYRNSHEERIQQIKDSEMTEKEKNDAIEMSQIKLTAKLRMLNAMVYDPQKTSLQDIRDLLQEIDALSQDLDVTAQKGEITWQNYYDWTMMSLNAINGIIEAYDRHEQQLDRLDRRTERNINRIRQRARDEGRPLTIQEQRRIKEIQEDAAVRREEIDEQRENAGWMWGGRIIGAIGGGIIGALVGGPAGLATGISVGYQGGGEIGRLGGNLFHESINDREAVYAGMRTATMTASEIKRQDYVNARDYSREFSGGFMQKIASDIAPAAVDTASKDSWQQPINITLNNQWNLQHRELSALVEEIKIGQDNGTIPAWS